MPQVLGVLICSAIFFKPALGLYKLLLVAKHRDFKFCLRWFFVENSSCFRHIQTEAFLWTRNVLNDIYRRVIALTKLSFLD